MAKRIIIAEAHADAPKPLRGAPDGSGYRDMARSESSAQELGRPADGKPTAGVGRDRSSGEAGNGRGAKGPDTENASKGIGVKSLRRRHLTEREIWEIGAKRHLTKYPDIALMTERLKDEIRTQFPDAVTHKDRPMKDALLMPFKVI